MLKPLPYGLILLLLLLIGCVSDFDIFKNTVSGYYHAKYEGVVTKTYIDWDNHGYRKVIFKNKYDKFETIFLDYEPIQFFSFIKKGDSISKPPKSLGIHLKRKDLDTVLTLSFGVSNYTSERGEFLLQLNSIYK